MAGRHIRAHRGRRRTGLVLAIAVALSFVWLGPGGRAIGSTEPPSISSLSVVRGTVGTPVMILGTGLADVTEVTFGTTPASSFTAVSDTQIDTSVPDGAITAPITVTAPLGSATSATFTVLPRVDGIVPNAGVPGDQVVIQGSAFVALKQVEFARSKRAVVVGYDYHAITVLVPPDSITGFVRVSVTAGTAISPTQFTVGAPSPTPTPTPTPTPSPPPPTAFACTRVLGFSQTDQWYTNGQFEQYVDGTKWESGAKGGGNLNEYANPDSFIWDAKIFSPCASGGPPDRILLTMGVKLDLLPQVITLAHQAIQNIRDRWPTVRQIILQPAVGGPDDATCYFLGRAVGTSVMHPPIEQDIPTVVAEEPLGDVVQGITPGPHVLECEMFSDPSGHFYAYGYQYVAQTLGTFYASFG